VPVLSPEFEGGRERSAKLGQAKEAKSAILNRRPQR
jgi:hypothetical protein